MAYVLNLSSRNLQNEFIFRRHDYSHMTYLNSIFSLILFSYFDFKSRFRLFTLRTREPWSFRSPFQTRPPEEKKQRKKENFNKEQKHTKTKRETLFSAKF